MSHILLTCDDFLSEEDLHRYQTYVCNKRASQGVNEDNELAQDFWERYQNRLHALIQTVSPSTTLNGVGSSVTVTHTMSPIGRHVDVNHHGERYKVLIYLNHVPKGGTLFYPSSGTERVQNRTNRLVLFDMGLLHESEKFNFHRDKVKKLAIGFRLL